MAVLLPLVIATVFSHGLCTNTVEQSDSSEERLRLQAMEEVSYRSENTHQESIASIMKGMSLPKAVAVLQKSSLNQSNVMTAANLVLNVKGHKQFRQPKGYSGIDGARELLNEMIFESMRKYDAAIMTCTASYAERCAEMEVCRGKIDGANCMAANSRTLILDSKAVIEQAEEEIPEKKQQLWKHKTNCKMELMAMNNRLKIVRGDIEVMSTILEMTDCDKKTFAQKKQWSLLHCKDECTKKSFIMFDSDGLQKAVNKLKSRMPEKLMADTFKDVFAGIESLESISFTQIVSKRQPGWGPVANTTQFNHPPAPRAAVPQNPCDGGGGGAPADKRTKKCTVASAPRCSKLQERFLAIQSGMQDERDELQESIGDLEKLFLQRKKTLTRQRRNAEARLGEAQVQLAAAMEKEANAASVERETTTENTDVNMRLEKEMKECSQNYIDAESEMCALRKIRIELYKIKGGKVPVFQDCEVGKWDPQECSLTCGGGIQTATRNILTHPNLGATCLPFAQRRSCNLQPCPVHCQLGAWNGWSTCSADCGCGVRQRTREVKVAMMYDGNECDPTSEEEVCNSQACERECDLYGWTEWSACSKDCDGGTQKRSKSIQHPAEGAGKCPGMWDLERLQYKKCNMHRCKMTGTGPMHCDKSMDIILLIDGSGSLGKRGWKEEIKAAEFTVDAFNGSTSQMAVILYSGPRTWGGVRKCTGRDAKEVNLQDCGIKKVTEGFTDDLAEVKQLVTGLTWPRGSTLTSLALMTGKAMLTTGRAATESAFIVYTDGRPLSFRKTGMASRQVREAARLLWVPVGRFAPLRLIKEWATRRWQENVVAVKDFKELGTPDVVTHIVADLCPKYSQMMTFSQ